ncbi:MAG: glycosyltransferase family 4 protein [Anaerolineae bacterium]|nr:glycosyltransferase family 4 protein [Anaerolineae bacterium]
MVKHVCLVRHNYYPENVLVYREAMALRDYGYDVDVICLRGRSETPSEEVDGIHVTRLPLRRVKGGVLRYIYDYTSFFLLAMGVLAIRHLRKRYAFIQVNSMPDFLVFVTWFPRLLGAKVVLQMYEPTPELWAARRGIETQEELDKASFRSRMITRILRWIEQISLWYASAVLTVTEQLKANYVKYGANPDKITVILNAPESRLFEHVPEKPELVAGTPERFIVISHGAIEERYGHDTMLEAVALVKDAIPGLQLRITGVGSYLAQFLEKIKAMNLENDVIYLGYISWDQLLSELQQADVGIVAQKSSLYSNLVHTCKMYDFMAFNKPVICSRLNSVATYFNEESLAFFTPNDPADLARALLELYHSPERRESLVRNAAKLYQEYRWEKQREYYWATYARLEGK